MMIISVKVSLKFLRSYWDSGIPCRIKDWSYVLKDTEEYRYSNGLNSYFKNITCVCNHFDSVNISKDHDPDTFHSESK